MLNEQAHDVARHEKYENYGKILDKHACEFVTLLTHERRCNKINYKTFIF